MDSSTYTLAWSIYLVAALVLSWVAWRIFSRYLLREFAYLLECWMLAILLTPWYVIMDQDMLGPAWMIFILDTVTMDIESGIRALIPVTAAMLFGLVLAVILSVIYRIRRHSSRAR